MKMNKIIALISIGCLISCATMSQEQNCNSNDDEFLSVQESNLLNSLLEQSQEDFNFQGKKIAFITGNKGNKIISKSEYFNTCVNPWLNDGINPQIGLVKLTEEEKKQSGGYDALVFSWVKIFTKKQKKRIIKQLSQNE